VDRLDRLIGLFAGRRCSCTGTDGAVGAGIPGKVTVRLGSGVASTSGSAASGLDPGVLVGAILGGSALNVAGGGPTGVAGIWTSLASRAASLCWSSSFHSGSREGISSCSGSNGYWKRLSEKSRTQGSLVKSGGSSPSVEIVVNQSSNTQWYWGEIRWVIRFRTIGTLEAWFLDSPRKTARLDRGFHFGSFFPSWRAGSRT
jgi:hypothetical protein